MADTSAGIVGSITRKDGILSKTKRAPANPTEKDNWRSKPWGKTSRWQGRALEVTRNSPQAWDWNLPDSVCQ
eukprot:13700479-Heterocapsa_arctica.AAC.1